MEINNSKVLVIGGAGFIGSHVVSELLKTDIGQVVVYDNLTRGKKAISKKVWKILVAPFIQMAVILEI